MNTPLTMLLQGEVALVALLVIALVISLSFHEFGHALVAKLYGDDTAERAGRLTMNPLMHIDPMGLLMVMTVGFGYARPVPTDPRNFRSRYAPLWVAAAGPGMNLVLAVLTVNVYALGLASGAEFFYERGPQIFFMLLAQINLLLMIFNLIPLGPLDGHYILPYFLPPRLARAYLIANQRWGVMILLGLILASFVGVPVFPWLLGFSQSLLPWIVFF